MNILVTGAGGFIGGHLVKKLKDQGHWVRAVDIKPIDQWWQHGADEEMVLDLRDEYNCKQALDIKSLLPHNKLKFDEVYQLAADMGGMGFISSHDVDCLTNNVLINLNMIKAATEAKVKKYFYSSSVCMYPDMDADDPPMTEDQAYPAMPDNDYGWEKLYSERIVQAYGKEFPIDVRIARFQNTYGPNGTWDGGREKAPAALSRKIAQTELGDEVEIWGDGTAIRNYTYIDDLLNGIELIMAKGDAEPYNIGTDEYVTVDELVETIDKVAKKYVIKKYVAGPVGVKARNFSNEKIKGLGWKPKYTLLRGIQKTYPWIEKQCT